MAAKRERQSVAFIFPLRKDVTRIFVSNNDIVGDIDLILAAMKSRANFRADSCAIH